MKVLIKVPVVLELDKYTTEENMKKDIENSLDNIEKVCRSNDLNVLAINKDYELRKRIMDM